MSKDAQGESETAAHQAYESLNPFSERRCFVRAVHGEYGRKRAMHAQSARFILALLAYRQVKQDRMSRAHHI